MKLKLQVPGLVERAVNYAPPLDLDATVFRYRVTHSGRIIPSRLPGPLPWRRRHAARGRHRGTGSV